MAWEAAKKKTNSAASGKQRAFAPAFGLWFKNLILLAAAMSCMEMTRVCSRDGGPLAVHDALGNADTLDRECLNSSNELHGNEQVVEWWMSGPGFVLEMGVGGAGDCEHEGIAVEGQYGQVMVELTGDGDKAKKEGGTTDELDIIEHRLIITISHKLHKDLSMVKQFWK
ncbi:hypothetical protein EI94DRAFT_1700766 [Lactarius quietus]|nr:hypothetical protein EI94DRAFT_1700766 [Lactarius quietus]